MLGTMPIPISLSTMLCTMPIPISVVLSIYTTKNIQLDSMPNSVWHRIKVHTNVIQCRSLHSIESITEFAVESGVRREHEDSISKEDIASSSTKAHILQDLIKARIDLENYATSCSFH